MRIELLVCFILLFCINVRSQQPFPLEFKGFGAKWQHLDLNDGGIGLGQTESIYTTLDVRGILEADSFIYVLFRTKKGFLSTGVKLVKINARTGEIIWENTDNIYTGNDTNQNYWGLFLDDDGRIVLTGWRAKDNAHAFSPNACIKKYDASSGRNILYKTDTTQHQYFIVNDYLYPIGKDSIYFGGSAIIENVEQNPREGIQFYTFSKDLQWDTLSQVIYNLPKLTDSFSRDYITVNPRYSIINDHLLAILTFYVNEGVSELKTRAEFTLVDYSDVKNLLVLNRFYFGDEVLFWPDEELYYRITNYDEEIQLTWRYPKLDEDSDKLLKACSFLAMDTIGNILARVDDMAQNGHWIYNLKCAGKLNDKYYLLGHRSDDRASFDIFEVDQESRVKLLVTVITADRPSNDGFNGDLTAQKITKDSLFIFSGALFTSGGEVVPNTTSTHYTMAFDLRPFMKTTSSKEVFSELLVIMYPNPAHDFVHIEVPDVKGQLNLYSANGALLKTIAINGSQSLLVDTSLFPTGVNVVSIESSHKSVRSKAVTFIKH